jgi:glutathione S-transferase kappa 1
MVGKNKKQKFLRYYYDIVSPYSYIGYIIMSRYAKNIRSQVDVEFIPISLGGIMKLSENQSPITNVKKAKYVTNDLKRIGKSANIPIKLMPSVFPRNTLNTMRFLTVLRQFGNTELYEFTIKNLFEAYWVNDLAVNEMEVISYIFSSTVKKNFTNISSEDIKSLLRRVSSEETKQLLTKTTEDLVNNKGAFGAPWIVANKGEEEDECFFGSDRIENVLNYLNIIPLKSLL